MNAAPVLLVILGLAIAPRQDPNQAQNPIVPAPGHWPQWRGPNRDNVSEETGLLKEWPEGGPKLLWKAEGIGEGTGTVSVAGGIIFVLGFREKREFVTALDGAGRFLWSVDIGPETGENKFMRYVTPRTPTIDDDRLYATTRNGALLCMGTADGRILWQKDFLKDFGGRMSAGWGFSDFPVVDGNLIVCAPGGTKGTTLALHKKTGASAWRCAELTDGAPNAALVLAEIGGVRQHIVFTYASVAGIGATDGRLLWRAERKGQTAVVPTPIHKDGLVFVSSGFGVGCNAFRVTATDGRFSVEQTYSGRQLENHHGGMVLVGNHIFGTDNNSLKCVELKTGASVWQVRSVGKGSIACAEGRLVIHSERQGGAVALVEATSEGYKERGRFIPPTASREPRLTHPVIAGGRLYLRDQDALFCYDLRGPDYKEPEPVWKIVVRPPATPRPPAPAPGPDVPAAFVPTPQDVVEKMLTVAGITKEDVVFDLGSGDGRIVVSASKKYGCKSVGYEILPELVAESRTKAKEAKVDSLVTIEQKDLFTADLSSSTVVTLYLGTSNNARLLPKLRSLKPASRVVSHQHLLGADGPKPDETIKMTSSEDGAEHTIFLWTTPFKNLDK
jgi:outer membrane protein assembly factor BamB